MSEADPRAGPAPGDARPVVGSAIRRALPLFAGQAVVLASGFALSAALVGGVFRDDPEQMGRFGVLSEALQWIVVVALLGMPAAVLRLVPAQPGRAMAVVRAAIGPVIAVSVLLAILAPFRLPLGELLAGEYADDLAVYGWRAVPIAATCVIVAALHAQGRLGSKAFIEGAERVAVLAGGLIGVSLGGFDGLLWGILAGSIAACVLAFVRMRSAMTGSDPVSEAPVRFADLFRIGAPQMALSAIETLRPFVLIRIVQDLVDKPSLGHFATAKTFALPLVIAPELLAQALFPAMHGPAGESGHVEGERKRFVRDITVLGALVCLVYGALAAWLLPRVGDSGKYAGAVVPLLAMLPGVLAQGATAHTGYVLLVRDRLGSCAVVAGIAAVVTTGMALFLVPAQGWEGGATGAAIALSAGLLVRSALLVVLARKK